MKYVVVVPATLLLIAGCTSSTNRYPGPLSPEEALAAFEIRDGFQVEVFAAEPYLMDPVELVFDESGNAYVVEMPDYPYKPAPGQGKSRVRRLIDRDGDGRIDSSIVFVDGLSEATSAMAWEGGLLVTAAPEIIHFRDLDGDGRADQREVLFRGFFKDNPEAQITNLRFNVDNWIYASNFGQPGTITYARDTTEAAVDVAGGDFRFRLDRGQFEVAAGPTQFGQAIDDGGNRFATHNTIHISHLVIPRRYLHRHPYLSNTRVLRNVSDHDLRMYQLTEAPYWRAERTRRRQKAYDEAGTGRIEYAADHFTGSSGGTVYDGDLFPPQYRGNVFTGDVAGSLVHRDVLHPLEHSPTFVAQRASDETGQEFLASRDPWFRPANFAVGPDGALYVVDMYRQHIETPVSIPEDLKADMDFYAGTDRGRIYRISPIGSDPQHVRPDLGAEAEARLVALLEHPAGWWRRTAHRLLLQHGERSTEPALNSLFRSSVSPQGRLHALYVMEALDLLRTETIRVAVADPEPAIRVHGLRLAEGDPETRSIIAELVDDPDPRVALQVALGLGELPSGEAAPVMARLLDLRGSDEWVRMAILSSDVGSSPLLLEIASSDGTFLGSDTPERAAFLREIGHVVAARGRQAQADSLFTWLGASTSDARLSARAPSLEGFAAGLRKRDSDRSLGPEMMARLEALAPGAPAPVDSLVNVIRSLASARPGNGGQTP